MPNYEYQCPLCLIGEEIQHSMSEIDNPSEETQMKTSCNETTCPNAHDGEYGTAWKRVPSMPNLLYFGTGTHSKGGLKTLDEKSKYAKERATIQSNKDGLPERKHEDAKQIKKQVEGK